MESQKPQPLTKEQLKEAALGRLVRAKDSPQPQPLTKEQLEDVKQKAIMALETSIKNRPGGLGKDVSKLSGPQALHEVVEILATNLGGQQILKFFAGQWDDFQRRGLQTPGIKELPK